MEAVQERTNDEGSLFRNSAENVTRTGLKIRFKLAPRPVLLPLPVVEPAAILEDRRAIPNPGTKNDVEGAASMERINGKEAYDHVEVSRDLKYVCYVCEKGFPSEKSLHGHMRTHPDRPYRGIQPSLSTPENHAERLSSWTSYSDDHVDLFPNGWRVKRNRSRGRGRNSFVSSGSSLSSLVSEQSSLDPILTQLFRELHEKELKRERRKAKTRLCGSKRLEWDSDDEYWLQDCFPPGWDDDFRREFEARKADELGLNKDSFRVNKRASKNKKRKHDHSPHHETRSADEFVEQASRNKRRKFDHNSPLHETGPADHMFVSAGDIIKLEEDHCDPVIPADVVEPPPWISHKCETCGKGFPTGKALGGHMRAHYKPEAHPVESIDEPEVHVAEPLLLLPGRTSRRHSKEKLVIREPAKGFWHRLISMSCQSKHIWKMLMSHGYVYDRLNG